MLKWTTDDVQLRGINCTHTWPKRFAKHTSASNFNIKVVGVGHEAKPAEKALDLTELNQNHVRIFVIDQRLIRVYVTPYM